jgi:hypothetical protein
MYLIKNNKLGILVHAIIVQAIIVQASISNKLSILNNKLSTISKKLIISSNKLSILVQAILAQAILVQRYSCAPDILYYIKHSSVCLILFKCITPKRNIKKLLYNKFGSRIFNLLKKGESLKYYY